MKKVIVTFILGILATFAYPQSYHKLIRTNTNWDEYVVILPEIWCYTGAERVYFTDLDTTINGFTYKISKWQNIITLNPYGFCPPLAVEPTSYVTDRFLREDTILHKVYIYTPDYYGGKDQLFYDFSLLPGDTLQSTFYFDQGQIFVLDSIGTYWLNNGESRRIFWFQSNWDNAYYIESIGNSEGLFYPLPMGFYESYGGNLCVTENAVNLLGDQCSNYYVGQMELSDEQVSLYPNPTNNLINVDIPKDCIESEFTLFNLQGEQTFSSKLTCGSNTILVPKLIQGVYIYFIQSNHRAHRGKLTIL